MRWQINVHWDSDIIYHGCALVREIAALTERDPVARCYVTRGVITRSALFRVIREGKVIYPAPGQKAALDVLKQAVSGADREEIGEGFECSLRVSGFKALLAGDVVEAYSLKQK